MYSPIVPLVDQLNWNMILTVPRNSEGILAVMDNLFEDATTVASICNLESPQALTGYMYTMSNGDVAIVSDYFGLTNSVGAFEVAEDDDTVGNIFTTLCKNTKVFPDLKEAFMYMRKSKQDNASYHELKGALDPLIKELYRIKAVKLEEILSN